MSDNKTKSHTLKPVALVLGAGIAVSLATLPLANADTNPFNAKQLDNGYMLTGHQVDKNGEKGKDGSCGEKGKDGSCGGKGKDGSCGENGKKSHSDSKDSKGKAGQCGAGRCGS